MLSLESSTLTVVVPGTEWTKWRWMYQPDSQPMKNIAATFGGQPVLFEWSGGNRKADRHGAASALTSFIRDRMNEQECEKLILVGFSHGGNVAALATRSLGEYRVDLVTIATPTLPDYQPSGVGNHINIYNPSDSIQAWGGESVFLPGRGTFGRAGRTFSGALNIAVPITGGSAAARHGDILYKAETWAWIAAHLKKARNRAATVRERSPVTDLPKTVKHSSCGTRQ